MSIEKKMFTCLQPLVLAGNVYEVGSKVVQFCMENVTCVRSGHEDDDSGLYFVDIGKIIGDLLKQETSRVVLKFTEVGKFG